MPSRGHGVVLAVLVLAVLAGCSAVTPGIGGGGETPTLTPAPVLGDEVPAMDGAQNVDIDADSIVLKHRAVLANASYTVTEQLQVGTNANVTFRLQTRAFIAPERRAFHVERNASETRLGSLGQETDVWWNGERAYYRYSLDGERDMYYYGSEEPTVRLQLQGRLRPLLDSLSVASVERLKGGAVIVAGSIENPSLVPRMAGLRAIDNATMTVRIGADDVVDRMAVAYDASYHDEGRYNVRYTVRITDVGATSVDPPAWLDEYDGVSD